MRTLLVAAALALVGATALAEPQPAGGAHAFPVATDARIEAQGDSVRLSLTLSRPVEVREMLSSGPDRIILDLPSINFQIAPAATRKLPSGIAGFRYGLFTADRARIILDLAEPFVVVRAGTRATPGGFGELVLELRRAGREEFDAAARLSAGRSRAETAAPPPARAAGDRRQTIVIDPGHGGIDPGAVIAAIAEKAVVLAFGQRLRERLEASGRYRVVMTRDEDRFVALGDRVRLARSAEADLFLSIHADSLTQAREVRGATIYTGSERASDAEAAKLAAKENQADAVAGLDAREDGQDVAGILLELARRETRTFSAVFARNLIEKLGGSVKLHRLPLRSAGFRVLTAPDVPSVLIELGYMSSPKDAELLNSEAWRNGATAAVEQAIDGYFAARQPTAGRAAAVSP